MIDKQFFAKYQKQLVWFINTKLGRWFFKVDKEIRNICEVAPNALTYDKHYERENGKWREVKTTCFRTNNKYAALLNYRLAPLHKLALLLPSLLKPEFSPLFVPVILTIDTYYPGVNGTNDPVDGYAARSSVNESLSTIIGGNGTIGNYASEYPIIARLNTSTTENQFSNITRGVFCFDTSSIDEDNIDSATISFYGYGVSTNLGETSLHICQSNPASTTAVVAADYQAMKDYSTSFGNVTHGDFAIESYNDITLNSSGITYVNKTGITKFGTKLGWDIDGSFAGTWASNVDSRFQVYMSNETSGTKSPKLTVTHSAVITFIPQIMFF